MGGKWGRIRGMIYGKHRRKTAAPGYHEFFRGCFGPWEHQLLRYQANRYLSKVNRKDDALNTRRRRQSLKEPRRMPLWYVLGLQPKPFIQNVAGCYPNRRSQWIEWQVRPRFRAS